MRIPDPKPMPLTQKARLLREVGTLQAMSDYLRTQAAPLPQEKPAEEEPDDEEEENAVPAPPPVELATDLPLCALFDMLIEQGRELADQLAARAGPVQRAPRGLPDFMDMAYAAKAEFFYDLNETDSWHRV